MTRKKRQIDPDVNGVVPSKPAIPTTTIKLSNGKPAAPDQQHSSLTISRNKHWRYISAFHGPWLQLPHEILETLAHTSYLSPRPRQTDPGVLFDLLKIRRLVDEASDLAVRAQNGTASSALAHTDNGLPGSALGLSYRGAGGNAKLSPERKYRMRELATQKLSQAYRLDEIAASVATMQSASTLDSVASLVLQRSPGNADAKYVHFFHEKIPSRMMAECTPLTPLNEVIAFEPGHAAPLRTRALTKIFKEDYIGAIHDLTEALSLCRADQAKHKASKNQLVTMKTAREEAEKRRVWTRDWMQDNRVADEDQPRGLEMQLLFQRGNQYLTVACQHIRISLENFRAAQRLHDLANGTATSGIRDEPSCKSSEEMEAYCRGLEARENVRKNAKRALRDYTTFFSYLDYAHALADEADEAIFNRDSVADEIAGPHHHTQDRYMDGSRQSTSLVRHTSHSQHRIGDANRRNVTSCSAPPAPIIYQISTILSSSPPPDLPSFPPAISSPLTTRSPALAPPPPPPNPQHMEMITYHPLMPETLHSLLLTHCLLQTPPTALLRHANSVARLARLADGYPFFLSARSPARADWSEILRKASNWIGLSATWEALCKPPTPPSTYNFPPSSSFPPTLSSSNSCSETPDAHAHNPHPQQRSKDAVTPSTSARKPTRAAAASDRDESKEQRRERIHKEAVMEALGDERVIDDDTFQRAVEAREKRAWRDFEAEERRCGEGNGASAAAAAGVDEGAGAGAGKREMVARGARSGGGVVARDEEYLIGTERAEAIARWVLEAPLVVEGVAGGTRTKKRKKGTARGRGVAAGLGGLENGVIGLEIDVQDEAD